jgi:hypothetical protein
MESGKDLKRKLDQVVGRAIRDEKFRDKLGTDTAAALKEEGLTDEELNAVSGGTTSPLATFTQLGSTFKTAQTSSFLTNITKVMWSSDLTCNERG